MSHVVIHFLSNKKSNEVNNMLKTLRMSKGLKQFELAYKLGIHPSAIGHWEQGRREIPPKYQESLSEILGLEFLPGSNQEIISSICKKHLKEIPINLIRELSTIIK